MPFPEPGAKWQVAQEGGRKPRWSHDGTELFYVDRDNRILSVEMSPSPAGFQTGAVRPLFPFHGVVASGGRRYDVSPDESRSLVTAPAEDEAPSTISLMTNRTAKLRKR